LFSSDKFVYDLEIRQARSENTDGEQLCELHLAAVGPIVSCEGYGILRAAKRLSKSAFVPVAIHSIRFASGVKVL
jgi:hypothetical protein